MTIELPSGADRGHYECRTALEGGVHNTASPWGGYGRQLLVIRTLVMVSHHR
jgi:hypothetical protein